MKTYLTVALTCSSNDVDWRKLRKINVSDVVYSPTIGQIIEFVRSNPNVTGLEPVYYRYPEDGDTSEPEPTRYTFGEMCSWRGSYCEPSLEPNFSQTPRLARDLVKSLEDGLTRIHHGWKGGEYTYTTGQELWAEIDGECSCKKIVNIQLSGGAIYMNIATVEY